MTTGAPPTSAAGGARYHSITATARWRAFRTAMVEDATHTAAERDREDRERAEREAHVVVT